MISMKIKIFSLLILSFYPAPLQQLLCIILFYDISFGCKNK